MQEDFPCHDGVGDRRDLLAAERPLHLAFATDLEPALRERRTSDVADGALDPLAIIGLHEGRGVLGVPIERAAHLVVRRR